ncbi:restriction endonuclease subunit S [Butyricicoccus sp. AF22-28AC]|jgi:type I restriction enzyme S subunit|uniref:restriction endonuclease subunit S n=1 Tax=Agathobaculum butyriciproducens TaxID=1628085 RepID=UPI000D78524E|nr:MULTISPECIES: restriction endonuclease subunit S [unclassified Butyricicoccus]RHQ81822.1 restriction endonuclease subunit S [Butyricicoccus sp. AF22-28AC]
MMKYRLGEICDVVSGGTPSRATAEFWDGGTIPWIKIGNIQRKYVDEADEYITQAGLEGSSAKMLSAGTILFTIFATLGEVGILTIEACTNQAIAGITIKNQSDILTDYLYYFLKSQKSCIAALGRGVAQNNINLSILRNFEVPIPDLPMQKQIVAILDKTAKVVEVRQQQLQQLDELVKARFVELFGDGNHPHIALIDLIIEGAGLSYGIVQPGDDGTGDMGVLRPVDMVDGKISTASIKYIDRSIGDGFKKTELYGDELLITVRGTTGITALTDIRFNGMNVTRGIAVVRYDRNKINPVYLNAYLNTDESQRYIQEHTRGATLQQINLSDLRVQQIMVPPLALQEQMAAFIEQTDKSKVVVQDEVNGL